MSEVYNTIPTRRRPGTLAPRRRFTVDEDEYYDPHPSRSSAIREAAFSSAPNTTGPMQQQRGRNTDIAVYDERPPRRKPRIHWLLPLSLGIILTICLVAGINTFGSWYQNNQINATYGMPRTWQTDAVVGHNNDSAQNPSHFIFENLRGKIIVIEIPGGDISKTRIYTIGGVMTESDADLIPVTGSFQDVNGDGRPDMIVHVGNNEVVLINDGSKFVPQS